MEEKHDPAPQMREKWRLGECASGHEERMRIEAYILPRPRGLLGQSQHPNSPREFLSASPDTNGGSDLAAREKSRRKEGTCRNSDLVTKVPSASSMPELG